MRKWFFSSDGKVTSPLSFNEAKEFLISNPDVYGWNASFKQWKPVSCISEFVGIIPAKIPLPLMSKEFSDKFQIKKQLLESKLLSLESNIKQSLNSLLKFEQQIKDYNVLTCNLNDNVKGAINNIEQKYKALSLKVNHLSEVIKITKVEITEIVEDFNSKMKSNNILMPSCLQTSTVHYLQPPNVGDLSINKTQLAEEKLVTPPKHLDLSTLTKTQPPKTITDLNEGKTSKKPLETITKVYRGVEYQVQK